jgi:hypothetical protein
VEHYSKTQSPPTANPNDDPFWVRRREWRQINVTF